MTDGSHASGMLGIAEPWTSLCSRFHMFIPWGPFVQNNFAVGMLLPAVRASRGLREDRYNAQANGGSAIR